MWHLYQIKNSTGFILCADAALFDGVLQVFLRLHHQVVLPSQHEELVACKFLHLVGLAYGTFQAHLKYALVDELNQFLEHFLSVFFVWFIQKFCMFAVYDYT